MSMDNIDTNLILAAGANYINSNHPDALAKRIALGQLLVDARYVPSLEAAMFAFRTWTSPKVRGSGADKIIRLCNEEWERRKREVK